MDSDNILLQNLNAQYLALREKRIPKGFHRLCKDIDVELFLYDAHISGLVESCLSGALDVSTGVDLDHELTQRMKACEEKLQELIARKKQLDEIGQVLAEYIETLNH